jgi:signal peptidase II
MTDAAQGSRADRVTAFLPFVVAVLVVVVDQITKTAVLRRLGDGHDVHVIWTLRLVLARNSGMAFSRGRGLGPIIGVLALVVIVGLLVSLRRGASRTGAIAVGLVVGGAIGNIADRAFRSGGAGFLRGSVIDFLDLRWWPVFNVADMGVVVGGALIVLSSRHQMSRRTSSSAIPEGRSPESDQRDRDQVDQHAEGPSS